MTTLIARIDKQGDDRVVVRSPAVGVLTHVPDEGVFLNPLQPFTTLYVLNRPHPVMLPHEVRGFVLERLVDASYTAVDFNRPLFALGAGQVAAATPSKGARKGEAEALEAGLLAVRSPSQGVFYRRPGPDAPAYVEEGARITTGSVLGLVEVMKCFNQIAYGGPGLPEQGTVAKILVGDAAEVHSGQVLFHIRPG